MEIEPGQNPPAPNAAGRGGERALPTTPSATRAVAGAAAASAAAAALAGLTGRTSHDVAVVLGSGWAAAADGLGHPKTEVVTAALPGFAPTAAPGHPGLVRSITVGRHRVLVFVGRTHLYEGHGVHAVVQPVRTALAAGCRVVVLTNAAGALRPDLAVGQPVLVSDHLNLTGRTPLVGPEFVDLTEVYSRRLRDAARSVAPDLAEGVYAALPGPQFETPAEIRMLAALGADLVGMSTVLEAIAARAAGAEVLAVSLVTNAAAGLVDAPVDHADVLAAGAAGAAALGALLAAVVQQV